jgi:pimeloyl-ACP methyl ester carboxylesterase
VRADRIGLIGISMGGVLAPRAAAFDDRIAAVVAFDGVYDMATVPSTTSCGPRPPSARRCSPGYAPPTIRNSTR